MSDHNKDTSLESGDEVRVISLHENWYKEWGDITGRDGFVIGVKKNTDSWLDILVLFYNDEGAAWVHHSMLEIMRDKETVRMDKRIKLNNQ